MAREFVMYWGIKHSAVFCPQSQRNERNASISFPSPSCPLSLHPLCKLIYGLIKGQASRYEGTQISGPEQMADKRRGIIEKLKVDQYLEAWGYMKYDKTIRVEL